MVAIKQWVVPEHRIKLKRGGGTPEAATFGEELQAYDHDAAIILAQGNHHPTQDRMSERLQHRFTFVARPNPVYKKEPGGPIEARRAVAQWERMFTGAPATEDNSLLIKKQGRDALQLALIAIDEYHHPEDINLEELFERATQDPTALQDLHSDITIAPNLRWRVTDKIKPRSTRFSDYDSTASRPVDAIRDAVERAGGARRVSSIYLCSPNNPTGRRYTSEEYAEIIAYIDEVNRERVAMGLKKAIVIADDPYFEAHDILHRDIERAKSGTDPFLDTGYDGSNSSDYSPKLFLHSFSKFAELAGSYPATLGVCTDPEFMAIFKTHLSAGGSLAYEQAYVEMMVRALGGPDAFPTDDDRHNYRIEYSVSEVDLEHWRIENHERMMEELINRCDEAGTLFADNRKIFDRSFGEFALPGKPNMVGCAMVDKNSYKGRIIQYPDGEQVVLNNVEDLAETIGNFSGVGLVPEKNDNKVPTQAYDPEKRDLLRFAMNDSVKFGGGVDRAKIMLNVIAAAEPGVPFTPDIYAEEAHTLSEEATLFNQTYEGGEALTMPTLSGTALPHGVSGEPPAEDSFTSVQPVPRQNQAGGDTPIPPGQ